MLPAWRLSDYLSSTNLKITPVTLPKQWLYEAQWRHGKPTSAIGHTDTAVVFSAALGIHVPVNRQTIVLDENSELLVGQLMGGRLPEGCTTLPENCQIIWVCVTIKA